MKIFAIIHNYGPAAPDSAAGEGETAWYEMADSSLLRTGNPMFVPDFDTEFRAFPSIVLRVGRLGKSIAARFVDRYIDGWTMGAAVIAINRLAALRKAGMPWSAATSFDRSLLLGNLQPIDTFYNNGTIRVECGGEALVYETALLRHAPQALIEMLSADNTLKTGDLILAGLTARGLPLAPGMNLHAATETDKMNLIDINIR